jgi:alkylated DNA repair dioxygenase AlkB
MNLLPFDGEVLYFGKIMTPETANTYFEALMKNVDWKQDEAVIFGRHIFTKRKVAWYGDREFEYEYSNITKRAQLWTTELRELKSHCEIFCGETFNSCLLNLYHSGEEGMAWHSDDEKDLKKNGAIASITLGAERRFSLKHRKSRERISLELAHGSLLVMKGETQSHWMHRLPPTKKIHGPRINLTFRTIL